MRTLVVLVFWLFVASVAAKAQRVEKRRGRRPSQRIADGIQMIQDAMESSFSSLNHHGGADHKE
jgi:hypothetical protein